MCLEVRNLSHKEHSLNDFNFSPFLLIETFVTGLDGNAYNLIAQVLH